MFAENDVVGLHVAVHDTTCVREPERVGHTNHCRDECEAVFETTRRSHGAGERAPFDLAHHVEGLAVPFAAFVDGWDAGMFEVPGHESLEGESAARPGPIVVHHLEGHFATELVVLGDENRAHAAATEDRPGLPSRPPARLLVLRTIFGDLGKRRHGRCHAGLHGVVVGTAVTHASSVPERASAPGYHAALLDSTPPRPPANVEAILSRAGLVGAALALVDGRHQKVVAWAHGNACVDPPQPTTLDSRFHLFSGTKLYTAAGLMRLVEDGKLELDAPVTDYLPELVLRFPVTVRQLASHDSGLPETLKGFLATHFVGEPAPSTAEALSKYRTDRGTRPGRGASYRNVNYAILGELISRVSGVPYEESIRKEILEPLGSKATYAYDPATIELAATGYMRRFDPMRLAFRLMAPATARRLYRRPTGAFMPLEPYALDTAAIGGLIGDVHDFVPLVREMLDPVDGVLKVATKREMLTRHSRGALGVVSREGGGLGWKRGIVGDVEYWNHEGGGAGFCSETRVYPSAGLGMVLLTNLSQTAGLSRVAHEVCEALRAGTDR